MCIRCFLETFYTCYHFVRAYRTLLYVFHGSSTPPPLTAHNARTLQCFTVSNTSSLCATHRTITVRFLYWFVFLCIRIFNFMLPLVRCSGFPNVLPTLPEEDSQQRAACAAYPSVSKTLAVTVISHWRVLAKGAGGIEKKHTSSSIYDAIEDCQCWLPQKYLLLVYRSSHFLRSIFIPNLLLAASLSSLNFSVSTNRIFFLFWHTDMED